MDIDLWGSPTAPDVEDDTCYVQTLRGCEFYFDSRLDVIEENALNERSCVQVLRMLMEKEDAEIDDHKKVLVVLQTHDTCCDVEQIPDAILQDARASSTQSALDEEANTSNISDAETVGTTDSSNTIEDRGPEKGFKLQVTIADDLKTVQPAGAVNVSCIDASTENLTEKGSISSGSESTIKSEEVGEHSCLSSLATTKILNPKKEADTTPTTTAEDSAANISRDEVRHLKETRESGNSNLKASEHHSFAANKSKYGIPSLRHLVPEARQMLREETNAPAEKMNPSNLNDEDEERRNNHHQTDSFQEILIATEPFTMDCLLEMCDGQDEGSETSCDKKQKRSQPEAGHVAGSTDAYDEPIENLSLKPARQKPRSNALLALPSAQNPASITIKKVQQKSSNSNTGPNKSLIRNTKQKVTPTAQGEVGETNADRGEDKKSTKKRKNCSAQLMPGATAGTIVPMLSSDPPWDAVNRRSESSIQILSDLEISSSELKVMKTHDLRAIAKALKVTHYYKLKKNDLLQQLTNRLSPS